MYFGHCKAFGGRGLRPENVSRVLFFGRGLKFEDVSRSKKMNFEQTCVFYLM